MILTICPNPSVDCTIELDNLNVGKLNRINNKVETYSGKALNVAVGVSRLGEKSFATGFMFETHKSLFEESLKKNGVDYEFVLNPGAARVNYKIIDKKSMLTEINDKGEEVSIDNQNRLIDLVKREGKKCSVAVMSGSLPSGVNADFYYKTLSVLPDGVKKIVDTERNNMHYALKSGVYMVKPNVNEFCAFVGREVSDFRDVPSAAKKYFEYGVKLVLVSLGADGAVLTDGVNSFYCKSANVAVNSTVGAGDSMVAAASVGIEKGLNLEEILRMSVAAGTASITTSGTNLFYKDKYDEIYSKIFTVRI